MSVHSKAEKTSNAYNIFILVLTVMSLLIMLGLTLPLSSATIKQLTIYDNMICFIFLFDFFLTMRRASSKRGYFFRERGWLDLLGSIPTFGLFRYTALLRLARLSRFARILRLLRGKNRRELVRDVVENRSQYAAFITLLAAFVVLIMSSILVLQFESHSPDANIKTGGEALWWAVVTITTVGYGDFFPVTAAGRLTGLFVMFAGVGIIGALASILASILIPPAKAEPKATQGGEIQAELAQMTAELAALRELIAAGRDDP